MRVRVGLSSPGDAGSQPGGGTWGCSSLCDTGVAASIAYGGCRGHGVAAPRGVERAPVIARSARVGLSCASESMAVTIVTPADGPSLGVAPSGTCTWMAWLGLG